MADDPGPVPFTDAEFDAYATGRAGSSRYGIPHDDATVGRLIATVQALRDEREELAARVAEQKSETFRCMTSCDAACQAICKETAYPGLRAELATATARAEQAEARLAELGEPEVQWGIWEFGQYTIGSEHFARVAAFRLGTQPLTREVRRSEWRPADDAAATGTGYATGGVVSPDAAPVLESGCTFTLPSRAQIEAENVQDGRVQLRRRTPEESRRWLQEHRDEQISRGIPAEVIDALIHDTYTHEDPS